MSDPFGGMGGMGGLMSGLKQQMAQIQAEAEKAEVDGTAGGGLVTVRMNGAQEVLSVRIDDKAMADREMLEDLLHAAMNDAVRRSKEASAQRLAAFAQKLGLPPGMLG